MILTGVIFGLGLSELMLILVVIVLMLGPKRISSIKPFIKVAYKNYLRYMKEVNSMQGEMESMKKTIMEPIEEVEREAVAELKSTEQEMYKGVKGAEDVKKGLKELVERSKKEMDEARAQARLEKGKAGKQLPGQQDPRLKTMNQQKMNAAHVARGGHVGLLGKQSPGASRRAPFGQKEGQKGGAAVSLASALKPKDKQKLYGRQTPGRMQFNQRASRRQMPGRQQLGRQRPAQQKKPFWFQQQPAEKKTPQVTQPEKPTVEKPSTPLTVAEPVHVDTEKPKVKTKPKKKPKTKVKKGKKSKKESKQAKKKSKKTTGKRKKKSKKR